MRKYIFIITILFALNTWGQQTPTFTEYNYNPFIVNPAYAGVGGDFEATLSNFGFGSQNIQGAPRSFAATFHTQLPDNRMGLGAGVISDEIGVTTATQVFGSYSYRIFLNDNVHPYWKVYDRSFIAFGLNAGALLYNQDLLSLGIQDDPNFSENVNATLAMVGAGILFGHANFFAGISAPNLLGDRFTNQDNLELSQPIYGYTGYHFVLNRYQPNFILKPSLLFKYEDGAPFQVDTNISLSFKNAIEVGAGYRSSSSLNAFLGVYLFKNFRAIYSYNQGAGDSPLGNTHGIILSYRAGDGFAGG